MVKPHSPIAECKKPPCRPSIEDKSSSSYRQGQPSSRLILSPVVHQPAKFCPNNNEDHSVSPQKKKRVSFRKDVFVRDVLHRKNMSEKSARRQWLTLEEYYEIKADIRFTLVMMQRQKHLVDDDIANNTIHNGLYCSRGLESKTSEGQKQRKHNKQRQKQAVFRIQETQRLEGMCDPEFIAIVSSKITSQSLQDAIDMAVRDEEETRRYQNEPTKEYMTTGTGKILL